MNGRRGLYALILLIGLLAGIAGLAANIASASLPPSWTPYVWISWPVFVVCTLAAIGLTIRQHILQERLDSPVVQEDSHDNGREASNRISSVQPSGENRVAIEAPTLSDRPLTSVSYDMAELRIRLMQRTSLSDLKDVCLIMNVDYDNYPSGKQDFVRDLVAEMKRQGRIEELLATIARDKPWVLE